MTGRDDDLRPRTGERRLLAAVDESDNSRRAVRFVADFFGRADTVFVSLLSILAEPSEDFFPSEAERLAWLTDKKAKMETVLAGYRDILLAAGFDERRVASRLEVLTCTSVADVILAEQDRRRYDIVVVGRRGISHQEEFVFGSTSSKILHQAKNCAVLVVE